MVARPELDGYEGDFEPEGQTPDAPEHGTYVLAFYELDRAYGGSEEGGWWFNTGELVRVARICKSRTRAYALAQRANAWLDRLNRMGRAQRGGYRRDINSVCYAGGAYGCMVFLNAAPSHYPAERPHYE